MDIALQKNQPIQKLLTPAITKICAGLFENNNKEPYLDYIKLAEKITMTTLYDIDLKGNSPEKFIKALEKNLINRKEFSLEYLQRNLALNLNKKTVREKQNMLCYTLASLCGFI